LVTTYHDFKKSDILQGIGFFYVFIFDEKRIGYSLYRESIDKLLYVIPDFKLELVLEGV
jgi:hypothetical protein